jgi:hypothetical protein
MLRILGQFSIFGTKASVGRIASTTPIPEGRIVQIGLARRVPEPDSWCYESPRYRFHQEEIDDEVRDFISVHARLGPALKKADAGLKYAFLTLCPVEQSNEEEFACVLSHETLQALSALGVALQIAPEPVMPDAPYWTERKQ